MWPPTVGCAGASWSGCGSSGLTCCMAEVNGRLIPGPPKTEAGRRTVTLPAVAAVALAEHLGQLR